MISREIKTVWVQDPGPSSSDAFDAVVVPPSGKSILSVVMYGDVRAHQESPYRPWPFIRSIKRQQETDSSPWNINFLFYQHDYEMDTTSGLPPSFPRGLEVQLLVTYIDMADITSGS